MQHTVDRKMQVKTIQVSDCNHRFQVGMISCGGMILLLIVFLWLSSTALRGCQRFSNIVWNLDSVLLFDTVVREASSTLILALQISLLSLVVSSALCLLSKHSKEKLSTRDSQNTLSITWHNLKALGHLRNQRLALAILVEGLCVFYEVQCISSVKTGAFVLLYCLHTDPKNGNRGHQYSGPNFHNPFLCLCQVRLRSHSVIKLCNKSIIAIIAHLKSC